MSKRKAISKKRRFEIFKRDGFTCSYCGSHPPKVVLELDHIVPVSKGGNNGSNNLTTSCFNCNRGKGATELSSIPESLKDRSEKIKEAEKQLLAYRKIIQSQIDRIESDIWDVIHELYSDDCNEVSKREFTSVKTFLSRLDKYEVIEAAEIASLKNYSSRFKYFCGICWTKIKSEDDYAQS